MVIALPVVRIGKKDYFFDDRLKQLRNVENPHDFIDLTDLETLVLGLIYKKKEL